MSSELSAVIVAVPEADPVVGSFRSALDSGAAAGVPAHITILYPFMSTDDLGPDVIGELRGLFAPVPAFEIALTSMEWFDQDVVYVRPEPDYPLRQLTTLMVERWPAWAPYGGVHSDPTPHLTVGDNGDVSAMGRAADVVARSLPLRVEVTEVQLWAGTAEPGSWHHLESFPLVG